MSVKIDGKEYFQMFPPEEWDSPEAFKFAHVKGLAPMLAKELDTEEEQDKALSSTEYMIEEKFDGTRALVHFFSSNGTKAVEFTEDMVSFDKLQLSYVMLALVDEYGAKVMDSFNRIKNSGGTANDRMKCLRGILHGEIINKNTEDGTNVTIDCSGAMNVEVTIESPNSAKLFFTYSYLNCADCLYNLIELECVGSESGYCRVFSRRISKKTNFYAENTDSLPHIRDLSFPELSGTVLDGEMFIDGLPFKEVSSTMNCLWDEAVKRQIEKGFISFHTFDIIFYKGIDLRRMPLKKRKEFLKVVVEHINSPYIQYVEYQLCGQLVSTEKYIESHGTTGDLWCDLNTTGKDESYPVFMSDYETYGGTKLSPRGFYEYITATGGEGVIVKPINGRYNHKRGWEYSKIKAFITREMILIKFNEPEAEYKGKFPTPDKWDYWETNEFDRFDLSTFSKENRETFMKSWYPDECAPISKYLYMGWVGNMVLGVLISQEEYNKIPKDKRGQLYQPSVVGIHGMDEMYVMEVCECSGYDEEDREYFTENQKDLIGKVFEVKANGIMVDSGRLRHPRYLRGREDKNAEQCTWKDHIGG